MFALLVMIITGGLCVFDVISTEVFGIIAIAACVWELLAGWLYHRFGWFKFLYHDMLGWHRPDKNIPQWSDGCSEHAICKYCGKEIMQDSQGNWFAKEDYGR